MVKETFSRRARTLKRVLDWVNHNSFTDFGQFMVLGNVGVSWEGDKDDPEDVQIYLRAQARLSDDDAPKTEESRAWDEINEMMSRLNADFQRDAVYRTVKERTTLTNPDGPAIGNRRNQFRAAFEGLSTEAKELMRKALQEHQDVREEGKEAGASDNSIDLMDEYYSKDVLNRLEKIMRRISHLEPVKTPEIPAASVEKSFEEAHRCFLYGFPIATAVLCRAVLAARLDGLHDRLDPSGEFKQEVKNAPPGKTPSKYKRLINRAAQKGLLDDEGRPLVGGAQSTHWAEEIIDAGNYAIHNLDKFNKQYGGDDGADKLRELLLITRKALLQLHGEFR